jgi:precorrin-8X/cobalt-precorrin-8 methylmutase
MAEWLYLASTKRVGLAKTVNAASNLHVVWRWAHEKGNPRKPVGGVKHLREGDTLVLALLQPTPRAYLRATIGKPSNPVNREWVIDRVAGASAQELALAGYPVEDGETHVIRLEDVEECCFDLRGDYPDRPAIQALDARDALSLGDAGPIPVEYLRETPVRKRTLRRGLVRAGVASTPTPSTPVSSTQPSSRVFDAYLMVDWSSSRQPTKPNAKDSIWLGLGQWSGTGFSLLNSENCTTRVSARARIQKKVKEWLDEDLRVLVGFDFAFGYPRGFARSLGIAGTSSWRSVHAHVAKTVNDNAANAHDGAQFADACNRATAPAGPGPFWGCHGRDQTAVLTSRRVGLFTFSTPNAPGTYPLGEWRVTDNLARQHANPQSVWKLNCGVSVGMQTITGIKHLHELRTEMDGAARVWPFETGFDVPTKPEAWFGEIFPSLLPIDPAVQGRGGPRDREQVETCVLEAARRDAAGTMSALLRGPSGLSSAERQAVLDEEGWMLFLT